MVLIVSSSIAVRNSVDNRVTDVWQNVSMAREIRRWSSGVNLIGREESTVRKGGPWKPAGVFDPRFAIELAQNANQQLGPGFPSQPY